MWDYLSLRLATPEEIVDLLDEMFVYYPNGLSWYTEVFLSANDDRTIWVVTDSSSVRIVGVMLLKHSPTECKICNLYTKPMLAYREAIVKMLIDHAAVTFPKDTRILITVPEEAGKLGVILTSKGYVLQGSELGTYRPGKLEYLYMK